MASEYESFAALGYNHSQVKFDVNYVKAEEFIELPPTFDELWCQGPPTRLSKREMRKEEKLFWRSRHRVEFVFEEHRKHKAIVVHVRETESNTYWRPIVVDLEVLFPLIDDKKILKEGTREVKEGSGLDDMKIGRAAFDYLIARLKVATGREEKPLPPWFQRETGDATTAGEPTLTEEGALTLADETEGANTSAEAVAAAVAAAATDGGVDGAATPPPSVVATAGPAEIIEVQAVLDKLSHDTWEHLEKAPPPGLLDEDPWYQAWTQKNGAAGDAAAAEVGDDAAGAGDAANTLLGEAGDQATATASGTVAAGSKSETNPSGGGSKSKEKGSKVAPAPTEARTAAKDGKKGPAAGAATKTEAASPGAALKGRGSKVAPVK